MSPEVTGVKSKTPPANDFVTAGVEVTEKAVLFGIVKMATPGWLDRSYTFAVMTI